MRSAAVVQRHQVLVNQARAAYRLSVLRARESLADFIELCGRDEDGNRIQLHFLHRCWIWHVNYAWSRGKHAMIMAPFNSGKCQPAHSPVQLADGSVASIGSLSGLVASVVAYDAETGGFSPTWGRVFGNGDRRVIRVRLRSGREIDVTEEHPFLTVAGWVKASDLGEGQFVGVANNLPNMGTDRLRDGEAELLGFLIGDGSISTKSVTVTSGDPSALDEVAAAAAKVGFGTRRYDYSDRTPGIRILNGVRPWLQEHRIAGTTSWTKTTPRRIFTAPTEQIAKYIGAYVACDGHVDKGGNVELYSVNRALLDDVRSLLLRLGIVSRVFPKNGRYRGQPHASWRLRVLRPWLDTFRARVPVPGSKGKKLAEFAPRATGRLSNGDLIPIEYRQHLKKTAHWHKVNTGISLDQVGHRGRRHLGTARGVVRLAAEAEANAHLLKATAPEVFWDEIVAIEEMGIQPTFGMEVDRHHTYLSSDVIVHNTSTLAIPIAAFLIGQNVQNRIKIVCAGDGNAKLRLAAVKSMIESYEYQTVFPHVRPGQKWDTTEAFVAREGNAVDPTLHARGVLTEGIGGRADVVLFDDVCTQKNTEQEANRHKITKFGRGTWLSRLDGDAARAMAFATPWAQDDFSADLKNDPNWVTLVQRVRVPDLGAYEQEVFGAGPDYAEAFADFIDSIGARMAA